MAPVSPLLIGRFMRLPRRPADTWQGGVLRMPAWVEERGGSPRRPWGGVWVSLDTGLVNFKRAAGDVTPDWTLALDSLIELGLEFAHSRPARLEVADAVLGNQIAAALGDRELMVTVSDDLWVVKERLRETAEHLRGGPLPPDALRARGVTVERMRAFATAARDFYLAAPWRHLSGGDLIHVEAPRVPRGLRYATVLGAGGQTFGLGFFASEKEYEAIHGSHDVEAFLEHGGHWSVLYGPIQDMPFGDADLWEEHALPVAGPSAHPIAGRFGPNRELRRPEAPELSDLEALLLALAETSEDEIDTGRWSREVRTLDGVRTVTLAIPALLAPLDARPATPPAGFPDRRIMERVLLEAERFAAASGFASPEVAAEAIQQRFSGSIDEIPSTATTPLERAQDLVYRAFEARGRRRVQLARKGLELSPDCADAYGVLAEAATDVERRRDLYLQGVAAGERALGADFFAEEAGNFWRILRTRPYMRVRFGLAYCLEALGRRDEAVDHYRELLRLNPGDNQGVRYSLLAALLVTGRDDDAGALLEQFGDEPSALWRYGRALWAFRREGDSQSARARLRQALRANRHVPRYLTGAEEWPGPPPPSYAPRSEEEAVVCDITLGAAWRATPGADRWLESDRARPKPRSRPRR